MTMPPTFPSLYRGICSNNNDPLGQSRIKAIVPQIFGGPTIETDWAWPVWPPGWSSDLVTATGPTSTLTIFPSGEIVDLDEITVSLVAPIPVPEEGVYIAFVGGDTEYPLWLGVWK